MIKKIFLLILIIFGVTNCGYTPMLSQNNKLNFTIVNLELLETKQLITFLKKLNTNTQIALMIKNIKS